MVHTFLRIRREAQPARIGAALDQAVEAGFMDRDIARFEPLDLAFVHIDAHHMVAGIGQAGACHESDVAGPKNRDSHS